MEDWAQDGGPKFGTLGTEFELLVGTTKLCILSKGDINWETQLNTISRLSLGLWPTKRSEAVASACNFI